MNSTSKLEMQQKIKDFLVQKRDFKNSEASKIFFLDGIKLMYEARAIWPNKELLNNTYRAIAIDIVGNEFPQIYGTVRTTQSDTHEGFIDFLNEVIIDWFPPIEFWSNDFKTFEIAIKEYWKGINNWQAS